ncbi:hypothetical protein [Nocardia sp. NPDC050710]|uniref:hypothetical protein n=1 Tax=Nocardia sp. NPDC050710 TaxID=3157220 RepID=UPI0033D2D45B
MFDNGRLEAKMDRIERKLDLIIEHFGIVEPEAGTGMAEIDELLRHGKKIQAIKRYRDFHPAAGLKEAKDAVEARQRHEL